MEAIRLSNIPLPFPLHSVAQRMRRCCREVAAEQTGLIWFDSV
jgi:hypothetical protein